MGTISIGATQIGVGERDGSVSVPFMRTGNLSATEAVRYRTVNDTAAAGADYTSTTGTATFRPGEARATVAIPILDDALDEGSENFSVQVISIESGEFGFPRTANVIIADDEAPSGQTALDETDLAVAPKLIAVSAKVPLACLDEQFRKQIWRVRLKVPVPLALWRAKPKLGPGSWPGSTASVEKKPAGNRPSKPNSPSRKSLMTLPEAVKVEKAPDSESATPSASVSVAVGARM